MKIFKLELMDEIQLAEVNTDAGRFVIELKDGKRFIIKDSKNESWIEEVKLSHEQLENLQRHFLDNWRWA